MRPPVASLPRLMRRLAVLLPVLAIAAAGCGSSTKPADIPSGSPTNQSSADASAQTDTTATSASSGPGSTPRVSTTKDLSKKPKIPKQPANPPTKLVVQDIVKGKGATATDGK